MVTCCKQVAEQCNKKELLKVMVIVSTGLLAVIFLTIAASAVTEASLEPENPPKQNADVCDIFCHGPVLAAVQTHGLFEDCKTFVDMPLLADPDVVLAAFQDLGKEPSKADLQAFVEKYFAEAGSDVMQWTPDDYQAQPPSIMAIQNSTLRSFALQVNDLWALLGRKPAPDVFNNPQRHTLVPYPYPLMVPGGRFRESYYWDTYWIVLGLLASDLHETAEKVVNNLLWEADTYGFVPNGGRKYYTTRSQPPLLTPMVKAVYEATRNATFLDHATPILRKEYEFWMKTGEFGHAVQVCMDNGRPGPAHGACQNAVTLNRFVTSAGEPRAESYQEDVTWASKAGFNDITSPGAKALFNNITAMAESGWDFSSRWFRDGVNLYTTYITELLPVDLNAILLRVENDLAALHEAQLGRADRPQQLELRKLRIHSYRAAASARGQAMMDLMFDASCSCWKDFDVTAMAPVHMVSVASFIPLWASNFGLSEAQVESLVESLTSAAHNLTHAGGLATTNVSSGQQWDMPNAWPPLQHFVIVGLFNSGHPKAIGLAKRLAREWIYTNLVAFNNNQFMYEKYDALNPGHGGGGGEYKPQKGFGWTNGVVLDLLVSYPSLFQ